MPVTHAVVRALALKLPDTEESPWYGHPAFKVAGKGFARLHEDGESLMVRMSMLDRDYLLHLEPGTFYITAHFRNFPAVLVRLNQLDTARAAELLQNAWEFVAPKAVLKKTRTVAPRPGAAKPAEPAKKKKA